MTDTTITFDDGSAYERFMGQWTSALGTVFLDWLDAPRRACWLEVGCGTGIFTELLVKTCCPTTVVAIDSATSLVNFARSKRVARRVDFRVADAQILPLEDNTFDVIASALVINFIPDRVRAVAEMRRVGHPSGFVAGYVWDLAAERSPMWPVVQGFRNIGIQPPTFPGTEDSSPEALRALFSRAGLKQIAVRSIETSMRFQDFDAYWGSQNPAFSPHGRAIAELPHRDRVKLVEAVRAALPMSRDGSITYSAQANAITSRVPR